MSSAFPSWNLPGHPPAGTPAPVGFPYNGPMAPGGPCDTYPYPGPPYTGGQTTFSSTPETRDQEFLDKAAMAALTDYISGPDSPEFLTLEDHYAHAAKLAYGYARALLKERNGG